MTLFQSSNLPVINRTYSLIILKQIQDDGVSRFSGLRKTTKCSKPCLALTLNDLIQNGYITRNVEGYRCTRKGEEFLGEFYEIQFKKDQGTQDSYVFLVERRLNRKLGEEGEETLKDIFRIQSENIIQKAVERFHLSV